MITLGIVARDKKAHSKPMQQILSRLPADLFEIVYFGDDCILNSPVEEWPVVAAMICFFSSGFPLDKAQAYQALRQPLSVNDLDEQWTLLDRRKVYARLVEAGVPVARHVVLNRDEGAPESTLEEHEDYVVVDGVRINKPFVEKPADAEDHRVIIFYPNSAGGGSKRLFRKVGDRSSSFHPEENTVRREGSFIYEEFLPTQGTDVKVYTVGPDYGHAEARKSPSLDGRVMRDASGKEVRYPVILSTAEKMIARNVVLAFKQNVCGFDLLRTAEGSFVCDVNGWSFVKNSNKYYDDAAHLLSRMLLSSLRPEALLPQSQLHADVSAADAEEGLQPEGTSPGAAGEELRCVLAIVRHGDRTPKQKMKMKLSHPRFLRLFRKYGDAAAPTKELKLKQAVQLQDVLDATLHLLTLEQTCDSDTEELELRDKLQMMRDVLQKGRFSGINRKVQLKPTAWEEEEHEDDLPVPPRRRVSEALLVLKWGGTLTDAGREQAQLLGSRFRHVLYPGDGGLLRLHSTYRHDLKIYTSDEGRVQMTAAAFAKGFLDLEGELTPILVSLVHCDKKSTQMLDGAGVAHEELAHVKATLHRAFARQETFDEAAIEEVAPTRAPHLLRAIEAVGNPREHLLQLRDAIGAYVAELKSTMLMQQAADGDSDEEDAAADALAEAAGASSSSAALGAAGGEGETLHLIYSRWRKLHKDFFSVRRQTYDLSKVPDIYDCIKHDLWHNAHLELRCLLPVFTLVKPLADLVIPQEYGITEEQKLNVARTVCAKLLRKIIADLVTAADPGSRSYKLDSRHAEGLGIKSPQRDVRSRLYFTSESHMHTLLNILRYPLEGMPHLLTPEAIALLDTVSELNYLTRFCIRLHERFDYPLDDPQRFRIQIHFSPGVHTDPDAREAAGYDTREPTPVYIPMMAFAEQLTLTEFIDRLGAHVDDLDEVIATALSTSTQESPARPIALVGAANPYRTLPSQGSANSLDSMAT